MVWYFLTRNGTKKSIEALRSDLMRPLPGMADEVSDEVVSYEIAMFQAALEKNIN